MTPPSPVVERVAVSPGVKRHVPAETEELGGAAAPSPDELTQRLGQFARDWGFCHFGVASPEPQEEERGELVRFLGANRHGEMAYLAETGPDGELARGRVESVFPGARSLISLALPYSLHAWTEQSGPRLSPSHDASQDDAQLQSREASSSVLAETRALRGRVAAYATGQDYHHVLKRGLLELADHLARLVRRPVLARAAVDTAPLLERQWARDAGYAFLGKNTLAIVPGAGSAFVLGELLTDELLTPTVTGARLPAQERCGSCTACLDACPTGALDAPWRIDATRCISYLTIEQGNDIPEPYRAALGHWIFGCDECQSVCPYNRTRHAPGPHPQLAPLSAPPGGFSWSRCCTQARVSISAASAGRHFAELPEPSFRETPRWL